MRASFVFLLTFTLFTEAFRASAQSDSLARDFRHWKHVYLASPDSAILLAKALLNRASSSGNKYYQAQAFYSLSKSYWVKANYRLSTEYGFKALKFFENSQYKNEWVLSLLSVARTLGDLGNLSSANQLISDAIAIARQQANDTLLAESYREKSFVLMQDNKLDSAQYFADRGIALFRQMGDSLDVSVLYGRKAVINLKLKNFQQSKLFAYKGIELDKLVRNNRALGISYYIAAQNEIALRQFDAARSLLNQSIEINSRIGNLSILSKAHEVLGTIELEQGRDQEAAFHFKTSNALKDSLFNVEKNGQIQEMQALYELGEKESTIQLLEKENALQQEESRAQRLFVAVLIIGILLLALVLFFVVRLRAIQIKANENLAAKNIAIESQKEELESQAEALQKSNRLQSKLFSVLSHDLRGPIGNLQGVLELFTRKQLSNEEMTELSIRLRNNLNVTQRTLENLLNWALSQLDGIKTEKKRVNIAKIVSEAIDVMRESADRKRITIVSTVDPGVEVMVDADQIHLVLRNLIHNGIKFSKIGDTISIVSEVDQSSCRIKVIDTGIGITSEEVDVILGSSQHFTKVGTQQEKGTGLGLLLCKEFIERNGGKFSFTSKLDKGTEVSFTLELAHQPAL